MAKLQINSNRAKKQQGAHTSGNISISSNNPFESILTVLGMDRIDNKDATTTATATTACNNDDNCGGIITTDIILISNTGNVPTGGSILSGATTSHTVNKNNINYTMLSTSLSTIKPGTFKPEMLSSLRKLVINHRAINVIVGQGLTPDKCNAITRYLLSNSRSNDPKFKSPERLQVKQVDFDINPTLRINLGYMYYGIPYLQANIMAMYTNPKPNSTNQDHPTTIKPPSANPHIEIHRLYNNFTKWVRWVKQLDTNGSMEASACDDSTQCCNCCKCMAVKGMNVYKLGNLPYLSMDVVKKLSKHDALWLPMA